VYEVGFGSEATAAAIGVALKELIDNAFGRNVSILERNRALVYNRAADTLRLSAQSLTLARAPSEQNTVASKPDSGAPKAIVANGPPSRSIGLPHAPL
jgi:hypothetical protein